MINLSKVYRHFFSEHTRILVRNIQYRLIHIFEIQKTRNFHPDFSKPWQKTVCFILPSTKLSGGVAVVCEYANRLKKSGVKVIIASLNGTTDLSWFDNQTVEVVAWRAQKNRIKREYDTVVATGWITAYEAAASNIPRAFYLVQSDERRFYPPGSYLRKRVHHTYTLPFRHISIAEWMKEWLKEEFGQESVLIRQGINTDIFNLKGRVVDPRPADKIRIVVEGAIDLPFKRIKETMQITNNLPKDKFEIWLVSSSGEPDKTWKIDRFFSRVPQRMMGDIYRSCHILLKLSTVEGMAGPPLEAMACGCVPVVQKVTGSEEYMIDKVNGLIIDDLHAINESTFNRGYEIFTHCHFGNNDSLTETVGRFDWLKSCGEMLKELGNKCEEVSVGGNSIFCNAEYES